MPVDKYGKLWDYVAAQDRDVLELTFDRIGEVSGAPLDHSFLNAKKNLVPYGFEVERIFMKQKLVRFKKR